MIAVSHAVVLLAVCIAARTVHSAGSLLLEVPVLPDTANTGNGLGLARPIAAALEQIRDLRAARRRSGVNEPLHAALVLEDGVYGPLSLDSAEDSGVPGAPLVIRSRSPGGAVFSGGVPVPRSAFAPREPGSRILVANLTALGITDLGSVQAGDCIHVCSHDKAELFFNGERQVLARYPNVDANGTWVYANAETGGNGFFTINATTHSDLAQRALNWAKEESPFLHGYWSWDWADCYRAMTGATLQDSTVNVTIDALDGDTSIGNNARFMGVNLLSELDVAGEYYISSSGLLYFMPPLPVSQWTSDPIITVNQTVLVLDNMRHVSLEGITVAYSRGTGISATNVTDVSLSSSSVFGHGRMGISFHGTLSGARDSYIYDSGCTVAEVMGGSSYSLTMGNMFVTNCTVHHPGQWKRTYQAGIHWGGVNNTYSHNTVTDGPHNCFLGGGNEADGALCIFEYNKIDNCAFESSDTGAFYTCGQMGTAWVNRGNVLRYNHFSNIRNTVGTGVQAPTIQAVYLDDQISGWYIYNNTFVNCQTGTFVGGGRDNYVFNNYYELCDTAHHMDDRGLNWQAASCNCSCGPQGCPTGSTSCDPGAVQYFLSGPAAATYNSQWPEMKAALTDRPCTPVGNIITYNSFCNCGQFCDASSADITSWGSSITSNFNVTC